MKEYTSILEVFATVMAPIILTRIAKKLQLHPSPLPLTLH